MRMRAKGNRLSLIAKFVKKTFGSDGYSKWFDSLPAESREIFHQLPSSSWYPVELVVEMPIVRVCELFYAGDSAGAHEIGRFLATNDFSGIYGAFFKLGSIGRMLSGGKGLWKTHYDAGDYQLIESKKDSGLVRISNLPKRHPLWEESVAGFFEGIGAKLKLGHPAAVILKSTNDVDSAGCLELLLKWD
jgi:hypothetical protein